MRTMILLLLLSSTAFAEEPVTVTIKVVDAEGQAVPDANVTFNWTFYKDFDLNGPSKDPLTTDKTGKATLTLEEWRIGGPLLVMSNDRKFGAFQTVTDDDNGKTFIVKLKPTVRVKGNFYCKELDIRPKGMNTMIGPKKSKDDRPNFPVQFLSKDAKFDLRLPVGEYTFRMYGQDVISVTRNVELTNLQSEFDLGTIDMPPTKIATLVGKPAPELSITDARGVPKTVKLSDYKGKWVHLEFWGFWCGPCVQRSIPAMIAFDDLHKKDRDKYVILTIHDHSAKTLAEMEKKTANLKVTAWQGRELPFPVLLDGDDKTEQAYGIRRHPTGILIDPEGNIVGESSPRTLAEKLPPLPASVQWKVERDQTRNITWSYDRGKTHTLENFVKSMNDYLPIKTELDEAALKKVGLDAKSKLTTVAIGGPFTYRSLETLMLEPLGLGIVPDDKGKRLLVSTKSTEQEPWPTFYDRRTKQLNQRLDGKAHINAKPLTLTDRPLIEALNIIEDHFNLPMVLIDKTIDTHAKISGTLNPKHLRRDLNKMLQALKLKIAVQHEAVVLVPNK